jgi:superfamily I DNA and RNA helicase
MSNFSFFSPEATTLLEGTEAKQKIEQFSEIAKKQTFVLYKPLSKEDSSYEYDQAVILFISGMKPCFIDISGDGEAFEDYTNDFLDDVSFLSEKFRYREKIGRKKHWQGLFERCSINEIDFEKLKIDTPAEARIIDLLISLVVGSINDIGTINLEAANLLDTIKSKIILFDTDQTSFVFKNRTKKVNLIQGLAGSGKTELLLHKLKEIYSSDAEPRIAFTCFNKILASSMKSRIPGFFDFMRVEKQIDWGKRLFCFHAWGSNSMPLSGMYRYICHSYGIPFGGLWSGSFDSLCKRAIEDIKKLDGPIKHIFDYVFIDEGQDFEPSFIQLCEMVTSEKVYVAGDVFQNIFRPIDGAVNEADVVLKKCYRTDPKNLMFSHALGMGLFERPVLRWLTPNEWDACGYSYEENDGHAKLSRDPLRRFEDIPPDYESTLIHVLDNESITNRVVSIIEDLKHRNPTLQPGDIAVIFIDRDNYIYDEISTLRVEINERFDWDPNVSFETKNQGAGQLFISNVNNAKGLEFPFVICITLDLKRQASYRNALYTMMARSFLESHLILSGRIDQTTISQIKEGLGYLTANNALNVKIPSPNEVINQEALFTLGNQLSIEDHVSQFLEDKETTPRLTAKLITRMNAMLKDADYDEAYINSLLEVEYERHRKL